MHPRCRRCSVYFVTLEHSIGATTQMSNRRTRARKGIVVCNARHGSTSLKKHIDHVHLEVNKKYKNKIAIEWKVLESI